ncbi:MAG TPA: prepilin-type N-terminal cleavage/methylation domain-containing protein [Deltaproteobacteria bacterium]|nr:prepilin-type N-terminal cleavage/methylation domain-containing protein [Deltaproteobacteria bacterium]HDZ90623.1 prepilin-type N-terminal cleavage/methylation domain-containing protein [Deltaproteobacteria bacterium]
MPYSETVREPGFTLLELLIAMAIALVVITSIASAFISQRKTYAVQEQISEMQQNARAAMDIMSREIRMTGYGVPRPQPAADLSYWIDWVSGVTMDSNPKIQPGNDGASDPDEKSDIIHIAACFDGPAATLSSNALSGDTTIDVTPVGGTVSERFDTSDEKVISIGGFENAVITGIAGNTLTIDTDPTTAGNQGLSKDYDVSATTVNICVVKVISYSIVQETEGSRTIYTLKRNENLGAGRQPLAENIVDLQITQAGDTIDINPLTAQTDKPDPDYPQNSGYRRYELRTFITPPNLLIN